MVVQSASPLVIGLSLSMKDTVGSWASCFVLGKPVNSNHGVVFFG